MQTNLAGKLDKSAQLRKRKLCKALTMDLVNELLPLKSTLTKSYKSSLFCCSTITSKDGTLTSRYCNQRWCYVCNRIRTARLIDGYKEVLQALPELRFVTLTAPTVYGADLKDEILKRVKVFRAIRDKLRKKRIKIIGVRKLEVTHNSESDKYHPHFHCMISGDLEAKILVQEWLLAFPSASPSAQDNRQADEGSLAECFKYVSKIKDNTAQVNDVIFQAVRGMRLVQSMGVKQISEDVEELVAEEAEGVVEDIYQWENGDWYSTTTGENLIEMLEVLECAKVELVST